MTPEAHRRLRNLARYRRRSLPLVPDDRHTLALRQDGLIVECGGQTPAVRVTAKGHKRLRDLELAGRVSR